MTSTPRPEEIRRYAPVLRGPYSTQHFATMEEHPDGLLIPLSDHLDAIERMKAEIGRAVAFYMNSEGCSCCESDKHSQHKAALAVLLGVPMYDDGSGYNFYQLLNGNKEV